MESHMMTPCRGHTVPGCRRPPVAEAVQQELVAPDRGEHQREAGLDAAQSRSLKVILTSLRRLPR